MSEPLTLASFANARELIGLFDDANRPEDGSHPLPLVRALEHIYNSGASTVRAVGVAGSSPWRASYAVQNASGVTFAPLMAKTPGSWGNNIKVDLTPAAAEARVDEEMHTTTCDRLNYGGVAPLAENRIRIFRGTTRRIDTLNPPYRPTIKAEVLVRSAATPTYRLARVPVLGVRVEMVTNQLDGHRA